MLLFIMMPAIIPIFIVPDLLSGTEFLYPAAIGVSAALFLIFLLLSPAFSKYLFSAAWSDDLYNSDMSDAAKAKEQKQQEEKADQFENLELTRREREIAVLLLQGMEVKQAAIELGIKIDTAKYHIKNLYKKVNIGGRYELFARFGTENKNEGEKPE
jgi:DNA-binding CsgD family transcriptional regulator